MRLLNRGCSSKPWLKVLMVLAFVTEVSMAEIPVDKMVEQNCAACHQLENKKEPIVGPSLVEIAHLYQKDVAGFLKWCNSPGKKRKDAIDMPSMAHVGDKNLELIHAWILDATKGKKYVPEKPKKVDPFALKGSELTQPRLQRIFLSDSSPASIAVTIDGQHSLCWDTVSCRMRYVWKGGFIDGFPYWQNNGNAFATTIGEIYYRAPMDLRSGLVSEGMKDSPKFKGYKMVEELPVFSYSLGNLEVSEAILNRAGAIVIRVKIQSIEDEVRYPLGDLAKAEFKSSAGKIEEGSLVLSAKEAAEFELTFNLKK